MNIKFRRTTCYRSDRGNALEIEENAIPMYVVLTRKCNASCKFCEYRCGESNIDIDKFENTLDKLNKFCDITSLHITGGEPSLEIEKLKQVINVYTSRFSGLVNINTNGSRLSELSGIDGLGSIALSRHDIKDEDNQRLFGNVHMPTLEELNNFKDKHKIHLSCNLIKGHVDSEEKLKQYLEMAASIGIFDIGLVSLMGVNEYCRENYVDFSDFNLSSIEKLKQIKWYENRVGKEESITCRCENYLYTASNFRLVSMYHRYAIKNSEIADYLVYENNQLKQGFSGEILEI